MPFLPALALSFVLLAANFYLLWEWRADQLSGDVMIHLIFARNFAEGRWFEYSLGQASRANTTILWEWILAVLGLITGQILSNEGFMTVARVFAMLCVAFTGWRMYLWGKFLGLRSAVSAVVCVFVLLNPVTFYWTAVNPMETGMTLVLATLTAMWVWRASGDPSNAWTQQWKSGLWGGFLIFTLSLIRPEMLAVAPIASLAFLFGQGWRRWPLAVMLTVVPFVLTVLQILALSLGGYPIIPTPTTARRMIALTYDTILLPGLGIPINPDAWKVLLAWSPLLAASLWTAFRGERRDRPSHFLALGICGFSAMFFSFYYYTTWQGRYMLPSLVALAMPAVAILSKKIPKIPGWIMGVAYSLILCAVVLRPLASFADAPNQRALKPHFIPPPEGAKVFLVQEVQSAYFYPYLRHVSTEGLITPEVYKAWKKGQTLYEFIMELRPDLIAHGRYYLKDPDGLQARINSSALMGKDLEYRNLKLKYRGEMEGAGPYFTTEYTN